MKDPLIESVQLKLRARGYSPGPIDGDKGPMTTRAIAAYQKDEGLPIKWPGTLGPITLASLFGDDQAKEATKLSVIARPWYDLAVTKKGLHERSDNAELRAFLRSDGTTLGDPAQLPWCGDFVETCIARTCPNESLPTNPYLARNWLKFGRVCKPQLGAVLVFWRGARNGISGHVAFCAGAWSGGYYCLGGNQSDRVSVAKLGEDRLLGARWPVTFDLPDRLVMPRMSGGLLSVNEE